MGFYVFLLPLCINPGAANWPSVSIFFRLFERLSDTVETYDFQNKSLNLKKWQHCSYIQHNGGRYLSSRAPAAFVR